MRAARIAAIGAALLFLTSRSGDVAAHDMSMHAAALQEATIEAPAAGAPAIPGMGGPFHLVDQTGQRRSDADFRGRIMLVMFGFTECPDVCPLQLETITVALERLGPTIAAKVAPIFVTVDPHHDTPERLAEYLRNFDPSITGLTGSEAEIAATLRAYRVHVLAASNGDPTAISHTSFLYVMGADGGFRSLLMPGATAEEIAARLAKYAG